MTGASGQPRPPVPRLASCAVHAQAAKRGAWVAAAKAARRWCRVPAGRAGLVVLSVALPGPALAQGAEVMRLAPPLPGLSRVTPLTAPVEVTRAGWGPFRRLCTEYTYHPGQASRAARTRCLNATATAGEGAWRVQVRPDTVGTAAAPTYAMTRRDDGGVSDVTASPPGGTAPLRPEQLAALQATARVLLESLGMGRQTLSPGTTFALPLPQVMEGQQPARGLNCLPEARARLAGRDVVVARCLARLEGRLTPTATGSVTIAGNFAVDIETGVLLGQGYATRTETFTAPQGQAPRSNGAVLMTALTRLD